MQAGDVPQTWADVPEIEKMGYKSTVEIEEGAKKFVGWFKEYHKV
jgi:UDP-glucuronate 4-epimerase